MSRKVINVVSGGNISNNIPKITIKRQDIQIGSIDLMDEAIAIQTLGMPLADFFENRNNYISALIEITDSSDGRISKSLFFANILQQEDSETEQAFYIMCSTTPIGYDISVYIIKDINTFAQALISISPIE